MIRRAALAVTLASSTILLAGCENEFKATCEGDVGGVYKEDTKVVTTTLFDSKGKPIFGTSTVTVKMCIKDGEVVMTG